MTATDLNQQYARDEILGDYGDRLVRTLRLVYGPGFASACRDNDKLVEIFDRLDAQSRALLIRDAEQGQLRDKIAIAG